MTEMPVREALERYRKEISILKRGYAQEKYRIEQISRSLLGPMIVRQVTSVHIASYRDARLQTINARTGKPLSSSTVRLELSLLSNFFDIGRIEWGICDANPVANVRKPKIPPGRDRRLTPREERLILRYCHGHPNNELYSIVVLALATAMRQGEILNLRWEHVHLKSRIAHLPETKNGTKRDVPLSIKARDALIRLGVKTNGKVFTYTASGIKSTWRFMVKKLGIENMHFHDCRHEAISQLFELGTLDMMEVASISGHKSLSMLKRYTHLLSQGAQCCVCLIAAPLHGSRHTHHFACCSTIAIGGKTRQLRHASTPRLHPRIGQSSPARTHKIVARHRAPCSPSCLKSAQGKSSIGNIPIIVGRQTTADMLLLQVVSWGVSDLGYE